MKIEEAIDLLESELIDLQVLIHELEQYPLDKDVKDCVDEDILDDIKYYIGLYYDDD